jgi:cytoskeletal protein RodZ
MPEETFGARLRRERERRHIALSSISENTKIRASLFEGLERDDVSHWPSGIFRKAYILAYAKSVGLDADAIAKEFLERYPDPADVAPEPVEAAIAAKTRTPVPARGQKPLPLVTVTVRVPRWMTEGFLERLSTAVRPWSRA